MNQLDLDREKKLQDLYDKLVKIWTETDIAINYLSKDEKSDILEKLKIKTEIINSISDDEKLDLLEKLESTKEENYSLYVDLMETLLKSWDNRLLDIYLSSKFPWEIISDVNVNFKRNCYIKLNTSRKRLIKIEYTEISIQELKQLYKQLKSSGSPIKVTEAINSINILVAHIRNVKEKLSDNGTTNSLMQPYIEGLDKELSWLQYIMSQRLLSVIMEEDREDWTDKIDPETLHNLKSISRGFKPGWSEEDI